MPFLESTKPLSFALIGSALLIACASPDESEASATTGEDESALTAVGTTSASCVSPTSSFVLERIPSTSFSVSYKIRDVVVRGQAHPGEFSTRLSPLGRNLKFQFWNGVPLEGRRLVTETRMRAEFVDAQARGINERVKCVADLGATASSIDRFRLAYEFMTTKVLPERHDPTILARLPTPATASLPANLARHLHDYPSSTLSLYKFEGMRIYDWGHPVFTSSPTVSTYHTFYDETGAAVIAESSVAEQLIPQNTFMTPEEWEALPRRILETWFRRP